MTDNIGFGELINVRNRGWEIAVRQRGEIVSIITPPAPTMDGSGVISFWAVKRRDVEDRIPLAAVPGAIEALEEIASGEDKRGMCLTEVDMQDIAEDALRAVRGEESA